MTKIKVCIKNLFIRDILTRTNRIFLKLKFGKKSTITQKHQIEKQNYVKFEDEITIIQTLKKKQKINLRFSFRIEKDNGVDFVRYGSFNIQNINFIKNGQNLYHFEKHLEKCLEIPTVEFDILLLENRTLSDIIEHTISPYDLFQQPIVSGIPLKNDISSQSAPCINNNEMTVDYDRISKSCNNLQDDYSKYLQLFPKNSIVITEEKYRNLQHQIDILLSSIVNDEV